MKVRDIFTAGPITGVALAALLAFNAPAALAGPKIDGTGTVGTCLTNSGKIKLKPALTFAGSGGGGALKIKSKLPSCSGGTGDGAAIVSGKGKGTGTTLSTDCDDLVGTQSTSINLVIKWKTDGTVKLNPSNILITSQTGGISGGGKGSFDVSGTVTSGSFSGANVTAHVETDEAFSDIAGLCAGKGVKKLSFGLNNLSNIVIN